MWKMPLSRHDAHFAQMPTLVSARLQTKNFRNVPPSQAFIQESTEVP